MTAAPKVRKLHYVFEVSIIMKGLQATAEIFSGAALIITPHVALISFMTHFTAREEVNGEKDIILIFLAHMAQGFSLSDQHFIAIYLLIHGIVKAFLVVSLFKKKIWAYPLAVTIFSSFIAYQVYRYTVTHSPWLILISLLDVVIILLALNEYRFIKKEDVPLLY